MELSVQNVYGLLIRSKLLPAEEVRALFERWERENKESPRGSTEFTKWLVTNGYVTEYQASLLARGHAEGFFIKQYKILERIGRGRMAGVYRAVHPSRQVVAIKVLPPSKAKDPLLLGRFQREARLALRLQHPNIVRAFQIGEDADLNYIVMEYLEGETLDDVLRRRERLPVAEAVRIVHQALLGLQHIHEQGMVHRDLKPANLMLVPAPEESTKTCALKILDIGLARTLFDESIDSDTPTEPNLTSEGLILGTPDYLAPEQARDARSADIRADIYSLGCVLYHTLAGRPPFPDKNLINQMVRHATEIARPVKEFNPDVPDGLQQILNWMIAKDPGERYPSPGRAAQALQVFLAAGADTDTLEISDEMRSYLSWLETETHLEIEKPVAALATAREPQPASDAKARMSEPAPPTPKGAEKKAEPRPPSKQMPTVSPPKKKSGQQPKAATPIGTPAGQPVPSQAVPASGTQKPGSFDVILLPDATPARQSVWSSLLRLTRRDFLMFGIGTATSLIAVYVGYRLAHLFGRGNKEPEPKTPNE